MGQVVRLGLHTGRNFWINLSCLAIPKPRHICLQTIKEGLASPHCRQILQHASLRNSTSMCSMWTSRWQKVSQTSCWGQVNQRVWCLVFRLWILINKRSNHIKSFLHGFIRYHALHSCQNLCLLKNIAGNFVIKVCSNFVILKPLKICYKLSN